MSTPRVLPSQRPMPSPEHDRVLLRAVLDHRYRLTEQEAAAFEAMNPDRISHKQRGWIYAVANRLDVVIPRVIPAEQYVVEVPAVRAKLPLKPPGRGGDWRPVR